MKNILNMPIIKATYDAITLLLENEMFNIDKLWDWNEKNYMNILVPIRGRSIKVRVDYDGKDFIYTVYYFGKRVFKYRYLVSKYIIDTYYKINFKDI